MSGVKDLLGGDKPDRIGIGKIIDKKFPKAREQIFGGIPEISTGFSTFNPREGLFSIDPTGRDLQLGGLERFRESLGDTRETFLGNRQAFEDATVRPLLQRIEAGRGALTRELGRTNVRGTFRDRPIESYDIAAGQAETDARAKATDRFLDAITALDTSLLKAESGTGQQIFDQELKALGFSQTAVDNLMRYAVNLTTGASSAGVQSAASANQANLQRQQNIIGGIGTIVSGLASGGAGAAAGAGAGSAGGTYYPQPFF